MGVKVFLTREGFIICIELFLECLRLFVGVEEMFLFMVEFKKVLPAAVVAELFKALLFNF